MDSLTLAKRIRAHCLRMTHHAQSPHIGSCLSIADILAVLYHGVLSHRPKEPDWVKRDRFILSKGHAAAAVYGVLAERGFIDAGDLSTFGGDGSVLGEHLSRRGVPGVEFSTGSLGLGLSAGLGMALGIRLRRGEAGVFVLLSDGECNEGAVWEAALFASHHQLPVVAIVDCNGLQGIGPTCEVLDLEPLEEKWQSFGWHAVTVDGHDHTALRSVLSEVRRGPLCVIARTRKGKGVSFMEDQLLWHYKSPNAEELEKALREVGE